jgi:hypothetical protein
VPTKMLAGGGGGGGATGVTGMGFIRSGPSIEAVASDVNSVTC